MKQGGSVPVPLIPPNIALQNPLLIGGESFAVFPNLDKILVMIDQDGDENYLPMQIPLEEDFPNRHLIISLQTPVAIWGQWMLNKTCL